MRKACRRSFSRGWAEAKGLGFHGFLGVLGFTGFVGFDGVHGVWGVGLGKEGATFLKEDPTQKGRLPCGQFGDRYFEQLPCNRGAGLGVQSIQLSYTPQNPKNDS